MPVPGKACGVTITAAVVGTPGTDTVEEVHVPWLRATAPKLAVVVASVPFSAKLPEVVVARVVAVLNVCAAFQVFAVEVETFEEPNLAQVVPPVAEIVVTALLAAQAEAPPYAPQVPLAAAKISADDSVELTTLEKVAVALAIKFALNV